MGEKAERGRIATLLLRDDAHHLEVAEDALVLSNGAIHESIPLSAINGPLSSRRGLLWARAVMGTDQGERVLRGYPHVQLRSVVDCVNERLLAKAEPQLAEWDSHAAEILCDIGALLSGEYYARSSSVAAIESRCNKSLELTASHVWHVYATEEHRVRAGELSVFLRDRDQLVAGANENHVRMRLKEYADFFERVERSPLTPAQRRSCVVNEDNNLVLAGAGTGKTSTMTGRAGYLLASGQARPWQILMLAYGRKAAQEMQERQDKRLSDLTSLGALKIKTFHALGLEIIGAAEGARPALSKLAEDPFELARFIDAQLAHQCLDPEYVSDVLAWCMNRRFVYANPFDFESEDDYFEYVRTNELRTLNGERVKSYEEVVVANFLRQHGITYAYEAKYVVPGSNGTTVADEQHRPYMPDFFLPEYGIYIEHLALNGEMRAPKDWHGYLAGVEWKRALHEEHGTRLIETRSHMNHDGVLEDCLAASLKAHGVELTKRQIADLLDEVREKGNLKYVTDPIASFLELLKQSDLELDEVRRSASLLDEPDRYELFFQLFEPVYEAYEQNLSNSGEIDFADMIKRAISHVESGAYRSAYKHVMVDEFQDISALRARLVRLLRAQDPETVFFAVGDDWQAIYRFTGSDVRFTERFEAQFGPTVTTALDLTFRFSDRIATVSSAFVLRNPDQIMKEIRSLTVGSEPAVSLVPTSDPSVGLALILDAIGERATSEDGGRASVLVLARYNYVLDELRSPAKLRVLRSRYPSLELQFMTVHAAKGKEADYVVVLGVEEGRNGFPAEKPSEPIMELVLPDLEQYRFAEERRLFYVALTRARERVYLVYEPSLASCFIKELVRKDDSGAPAYDVRLDEFAGKEGAGVHADAPRCPRCTHGSLGVRQGPFGRFVGCNRYPYCRYTEPPCPQCGAVMKREQGVRVCTTPGCDEQSPVCPRCGAAMVRRTSEYGAFWGCLNYRRDVVNHCTHTINIGSPYRRSKKYGYRR